MEDIICDISAFHFYRTPPQVLMLLPELSSSREQAVRMKLSQHVTVANILGLPLHLLVKNKNQSTGANYIKHHTWQHKLPDESICNYDFFGQVTSPLFTLFTMAGHISEVELVMAMYEMCGNFSLFKPNDTIQELLRVARQQDTLPPSFGWTPVVDTQDRPTNLWKRSPLIELDELQAFAQTMSHYRNGKKFEKAANSVTGVASSPFEVQASLLLSLPRSRGGYGLSGIQNNKKIRFTRSAKTLVQKDYCLADIYIENEDRCVAIECQGAVVHTGETPSTADADRTTALQSMNVPVVLLTYKQIADPKHFEIIVRHIFDLLGLPYSSKTARQQAAEQQLRQELFIDWNTLGL